MNEIAFLVKEAPEGGFIARALGFSIFTDAETMDELKANIREAIRCHFDEEEDLPKVEKSGTQYKLLTKNPGHNTNY